MKKLVFLSAGIMLSITLAAQTGRVGINTLAPLVLHVKDSSMVLTGLTGELPDTPAPPPVSGGGMRMMSYSDKAALPAFLLKANNDAAKTGRRSHGLKSLRQYRA